MKVRNLNGYLVIYKPGHPSSMTSDSWKGFIYEHIEVAEVIVGRALREDEVVHHLNFNRADNRPENLLVLLNSQHAKLHEWLKAGAPGYNISGSEKSVTETTTSIVRRCAICEKPLLTTQKFWCSLKCCGLAKRKVDRPTQEQLEKEVSDSGMVAVGKKYGVSDKAIKKWLDKYRSE